MAAQTIDVEAYLPPIRLRLKQRAQSGVANLCTLPQTHPVHKVFERNKRRIQLKWKYPKFPLVEVLKAMDSQHIQALESMDPRPLKPWREPISDEIDIGTDREKATEKTEMLIDQPDMVIYTDPSADDDNLGAAVVTSGQHGNVMRSPRVGIRSTNPWFLHAAKLIAIYRAVEGAKTDFMENLGRTSGNVHLEVELDLEIVSTQSLLRRLILFR